ncbi:TPA: hypothetical protein N0F65_012455, partial [Lagenidium giganteum]
ARGRVRVRVPSRTIGIVVTVIFFLSGLVALHMLMEATLVGCYSFGGMQRVLLHSVRFTAESASDPRPSVLQPNATIDHQHNCTPGVLDPATLQYHSDHRFYDLMKGILPLPPPVFQGEQKMLCNENNRANAKYKYCLPITGRKDEPYCSAPDRLDLLLRQTPETLCYGSALHMLLVDVYDEFQAHGADPILLYGTLLGAIRNSSTIPFTEDSDVGYVKRSGSQMKELARALWQKGYHMFFHRIWRVCIAPTHPLASNMYDPEHDGLAEDYLVPYVDLYEMSPGWGDNWFVDCTKNGRRIPTEKFEPYKQVYMNGLAFNTVADPIDFLTAEYGDDYMVPKPRGRLGIHKPRKDEVALRLPSRGTRTVLVVGLMLSVFVVLNMVLESNMTSSFSFRGRPVFVQDLRFGAKGIVDPRASVLQPNATIDNEHNCTPQVLDPAALEYHSSHRFYKLIKEMLPLPPPVFRDKHMVLCQDNDRAEAKYEYCLPITGRKDEPYCSAPDRMDLLLRQTPSDMCYGSALHMLLLDVYDEFKAQGADPILLYGTLLGAIRNGATIPFTEDSDVGYVKRSSSETDALVRALWRKGYHMFFQNIWRVCIAPTHPLASNLYDPNHHDLAQDYLVPYVDLYEMERESGDKWYIDCTKDGRRIPADKFEPYKQVQMNGLAFNTVADPIAFLEAEYGADYMVPKPRGQRRRRV